MKVLVLPKLGRIASWAAALAVIAALGMPSTASAAFKLRLFSVVDPIGVTIEDNVSAEDSNPLAGVIEFSGAIGGFSVSNTTTGLSKPTLGSPFSAHMDLNSVNVSGSADKLTIMLTDVDFEPAPAGLLRGAAGGTTRGLIEFWAYKNDSNEEFDTTNPEAAIHIGPFGSVGGGLVAFAGSDADPHDPIGNKYSMTLVAEVEHGAGAAVNSSFDFDVENVVPVPAGLVLALSGVPFFGLAYLRRRLKKS
jgi:hypothetical protein